MCNGGRPPPMEPCEEGAVDVKTSTRLLLIPEEFPVSITYTLPEASIVRPSGSTNWPFPEPTVPKDVRNPPELVNFSIRLLDESTTYTLFRPSTATPVGPLNCPLAAPEDPHCMMEFPELSNF